jgi:hypothetical protein
VKDSLTLLACAIIIAAAVIDPACDTDDLAAEVDRLQAENDALRAAARLRIVAPPDAPAPDGVAFREQGKPWQKYLPTAETQDTITAIMDACGAKPITISSSGYDPDASTSDEQVLSLGYSYMGGAAERACIDAEMDARGAVAL